MTTRVFLAAGRILAAILGLAVACVSERPDAMRREYQASSTGRTLEVHSETATVATDAERVPVLTARISAAATAFSGPVRVLFEIASGPNDRDGDSPITPDIACNVQVGETSCQAAYVGGGSGADVIRAWIDEDDDLLTTEADTAEGRNAGASDCTTGDPVGACSGPETPGSVAEPDVTDVVEVVWAFASGGAGQPCSGGSECEPGTTCQAGVCAPCGQLGAPCCTGRVCESALACQPTLNTCLPCGSAGQPCCEPPIGCRTGSECRGATCVACGAPGQPCCADSTCDAGAACTESMCVQTCGAVGQPCCDGPTPCDVTEECTDGTCPSACTNGICTACGGQYQPCCGVVCLGRGWYCGSDVRCYPVR